MAGYPVTLTNLAGARCVVVGGGAVAERKVGGLLDSGAAPIVIAPALAAALAVWREERRLTHVARVYQAGDLAGAFLVVAATDSRAVNRQVALEAARLGVLVNVADAPDEGNFHTVAAVRQGDLLLTVSTGGASPALAGLIRRDLAARYGAGFGQLVERLKAARDGSARAETAELPAELLRQLGHGGER